MAASDASKGPEPRLQRLLAQRVPSVPLTCTAASRTLRRLWEAPRGPPGPPIPRPGSPSPRSIEGGFWSCSVALPPCTRSRHPSRWPAAPPARSPGFSRGRCPISCRRIRSRPGVRSSAPRCSHRVTGTRSRGDSRWTPPSCACGSIRRACCRSTIPTSASRRCRSARRSRTCSSRRARGGSNRPRATCRGAPPRARAPRSSPRPCRGSRPSARAIGCCSWRSPTAARIRIPTTAPPSPCPAAAGPWKRPGRPRDRLLFLPLTDRRTNPHPYDGRAIAMPSRGQLLAQVGEEVRVHWLEDRGDIDAVSDLVHDAVEQVMSDRPAQAERVQWLRDSDGDMRSHGDGVTAERLGLGGPARWFAGHSLHPQSHLYGWGTASMAKDTRDLVRTSGALALLTLPERSDAGWIMGGQANERFALRAATLGIAQQPLAAPVGSERHRALLARSGARRDRKR